MASFMEVDLHRIWFTDRKDTNEGTIIYEIPKDKNICEYTSGKQDSCMWYPTHSLCFINEIQESYWRTVTAEECLECGTVRYLDELPAWCDKLDTVTVEESIYAS